MYEGFHYVLCCGLHTRHFKKMLTYTKLFPFLHLHLINLATYILHAHLNDFIRLKHMRDGNRFNIIMTVKCVSRYYISSYNIVKNIMSSYAHLERVLPIEFRQ